MTVPARPLMILVAGPYRSGTGGDPALIQANLDAMNQAALAVYRAGHLPFLGEWLALPLIETAHAADPTADPFDEIFHPSALRLLSRCDACLRIGGPSEGADLMVRSAQEFGLRVFYHLDEIPEASGEHQ